MNVLSLGVGGGTLSNGLAVSVVAQICVGTALRALIVGTGSASKGAAVKLLPGDGAGLNTGADTVGGITDPVTIGAAKTRVHTTCECVRREQVTQEFSPPTKRAHRCFRFSPQMSANVRAIAIKDDVEPVLGHSGTNKG